MNSNNKRVLYFLSAILAYILILVLIYFVSYHNPTFGLFINLIGMAGINIGIGLIIFALVRKKQNIKFYILILIASLFISLVASGSSITSPNPLFPDESESQKKEPEKDIDERIGDKIMVPATYLQSKEDVESNFKDSGLKVKFIKSNLQKIADYRKIVLEQGTCKDFDKSGTIYISTSNDNDKDKWGYYAPKGTTIIVEYAAQNYDGR